MIDHASPRLTAAKGCSVRDHAEAMHVGFTDHGLEAHATFGLSPSVRGFAGTPASKLRALRRNPTLRFTQEGASRDTAERCAVSRTRPQQVASPTAERFGAAVAAVLVGVAVSWGSVCLAPRSFRCPAVRSSPGYDGRRRPCVSGYPWRAGWRHRPVGRPGGHLRVRRPCSATARGQSCIATASARVWSA